MSFIKSAVLLAGVAANFVAAESTESAVGFTASALYGANSTVTPDELDYSFSNSLNSTATTTTVSHLSTVEATITSCSGGCDVKSASQSSAHSINSTATTTTVSHFSTVEATITSCSGGCDVKNPTAASDSNQVTYVTEHATSHVTITTLQMTHSSEASSSSAASSHSFGVKADENNGTVHSSSFSISEQTNGAAKFQNFGFGAVVAAAAMLL